MRTRLPAVLVGLLCLALGYRQWVLEGELDRLEAELVRLEQRPAKPAVPETRSGAGTPPAGDDGPAAAGPTGDAAADDRELLSLAAQLERLRGEVNRLEQDTADKATLDDIDTAVDEERILDVVKRKQQAVRARQLEFQRDRWVGWRKDALDRFAEQVQLAPEQQSELMRHLEAEADGIVELMQRPGADEDPWKAAAEWRVLLEQTDQKVAEVLDEKQIPAWTQARAVERRVLWPWLTEK